MTKQFLFSVFFAAVFGATLATLVGQPASSNNRFVDSRDGQSYATATIGSQTWMAENLNYDTADGTGSWCYANLPANCTTYGRLYDWNTVMAGASASSANPSGVRGICPEGWHMPSDAEWTQLSGFLWRALAGRKLKSSASWNGTDDVGFSALPAGYYNGGSFIDEGNYADFWSATEYDATYAWDRYLYSGNEYLRRINNNKSNGFSSRCVQD